ncbi:MAG: protein phosphatase 2C domain-containing protein [Lentisphaerae bacterium]|nr:protein phosphatase 2C domain-containing protein [Lentisphaerota bacterium]
MRVSPSKAQTEYLRAIGVYAASAPASRGVPDVQDPGLVPSGSHHAGAPSTSSLSLPSGLIVFIVILALLLSALASRGVELPALTDVTPDIAGLSAQVSALDGDETGIEEALVPVGPGESEIPGDSAEAEEELLFLVTDCLDGLGQKCAELEKRLATLDQRIGQSSQDSAQAIRKLGAEAKAARMKDRVEVENDLEQMRHGSLFWVLGFSAVAGMLTGLIHATRRLPMETEKKLTGATVTQEALIERRTKLCTAYGVAPKPAEGKRKQPSQLAVAATRAPTLVPLDSQELQNQLIATAAGMKSLRVLPSAATAPWQLGVASLKGNVRPQNQDVGVAFMIGECDLLVVADGCGGPPHGREAAYLSVTGASLRLIQVLGSTPNGKLPDIEEAIRSAIWAAHHQLVLQADDLNIACGDINGGLRTTLIIVVGHKDKLHFGYVGDGGGWMVRTNGQVERFLVPQKSADVLNVLDASMGPLLAGNPVLGTVDRAPGDLALAGSDGVFDRIPASEIEVFGKDILRACIQSDGDLQKVAGRVCEEYAELKDAAGFICDDNLTLGLMGTRSKPVLGAGFWNSAASVSKAN